MQSWSANVFNKLSNLDLAVDLKICRIVDLEDKSPKSKPSHLHPPQ